MAQIVWDLVAPTIPKRSMLRTFQTLQEGMEETSTENISDQSYNNSTKSSANSLFMLYAKAAKRQNMRFHEYCSHIRMLNKDSRKDNHRRLAYVDMPPKPQDTGGLRKILSVKVGARIMVTTNIDVSDGLPNGAMGKISDVVMNETSTQIKAILVAFDYDTIGKETRCQSIYKY